jgi:purine-binding chemotaxis protein CheW
VSGHGLLLAFRAGGARFAVPLERVREAARPRRITPLPGAPRAWSGVALVRGEALGIVDVAAAVGLPPSPVRRTPLLVVLRGCDHALLVDAVDGVEPFPEGRVVPPPPGRGVLRGVVAEEGGFLSLLDVDRLGSEGES